MSPLGTQAIDRRADALRLGDCRIVPSTGRIERPGGATHVEPRVMDVLLALLERPGRTVPRDELIDAVWGHPHVSDEALSRCISLVRRSLGDDQGSRRFVETVPKRGYRLIPQPSAAPASTEIRIAVLPFLNLSGDPCFQHFADGLTDLLITYAASHAQLRVVSRTSSMRYRDTHLPLPDIARELSVTRVVEGSVIASTQAVQAVLQLIDPVADTHILARTYRRPLVDPIEAQNDIASSMAGAVADALAA